MFLQGLQVQSVEKKFQDRIKEEQQKFELYSINEKIDEYRKL